MAGYREHLIVSSTLGVGYGVTGWLFWNLDWGPAVLGGLVTGLGGLLPDLDSDSGVPVRELFGAAAAIVPILAYPWARDLGLSPEQSAVVLAALYILIRYGLSALFKTYTVHRGMFHSIPAMGIAGLGLFLLYHQPHLLVRLYLAGGVMLGFLSHLILDELYSVDFMGLRIKLNKYAGSALKLASPSWLATLATYIVLIGLACLALLDWSHHSARQASLPGAVVSAPERPGN